MSSGCTLGRPRGLGHSEGSQVCGLLVQPSVGCSCRSPHLRVWPLSPRTQTPGWACALGSSGTWDCRPGVNTSLTVPVADLEDHQLTLPAEGLARGTATALALDYRIDFLFHSQNSCSQTHLWGGSCGEAKVVIRRSHLCFSALCPWGRQRPKS